MFGIECPSSIHVLVNKLDSIKNKNYLTHNIHPYPAKFIPQIPACIIENYSSKNDIILDPFCGSGTTLLESILRDRTAIGIDSNPIACLVSSVKTTLLNHRDKLIINEIICSLNDTIAMIKNDSNWVQSQILNEKLPKFLNINHWFKLNVQYELSFLLQNIINPQKKFTQLYDFLRLCLSSIIVKVSNQDSDTRWVAIEKDVRAGDTIKCFLNAVINNLENIEQLDFTINSYNIKSKSKVYNIDINDIEEIIPNNSVNLIVTSPPYLNSFDYYLYHKLRMFWLGYDHKKVQMLEIGSRNKHSDNNESVISFKNSMLNILKKCSNLLMANGKCVFIVGDSIYQNQSINMLTLYKEIGENAQFQIIDSVSFNQRKYSKSFTSNYKRHYKETHIIVMEHK